MKRILMTLVLLVLASFALTACATGTEEVGTATAAAAQATSAVASTSAAATAVVAQATGDAAAAAVAETADAASTSSAAALVDAQATADAAASALPATDIPTVVPPTEEVAATDVPTEEVAATEVATEEVAVTEVATEEMAAPTLTDRQTTATARAAAALVAAPTEEVAATEAPTEEVAATEVATEEVAATEVPTEEVAATEVAATEVPAAAGITSVCLVTDLGRINDGTFNQYAYEGMVRAAEDLNLDSKFIETQAQTDYEANIATCVDEGFNAVVTVGFLIADATAAAAAANPGVYFIGVDQFHANALPNLVGIQFREDQAGFLVGALAAKVSTTGKIAGVYGIDIPPVKKFRNGFEQGAKYINPDIELAGVYIPDFVAPQLGAEAAEQFVADGFDVVFGAGGPTGSGGIVRAAELGAMVIGVDQDEWVTTFGAGETPGADKIISSALKRVDQGVYDMVWTLAAGDALPEGSLYLMDAAVNGVGFAEGHDAVIAEDITASVQEIFTLLASGELSTGVDPVTGDLLVVEEAVAAPTEEAAEPAATEVPATAGITSVCLVTDLGRINDGTFNQYAYEGMVRAAEDLNLDSKFIETQAQTDYEANIATCVDEGFNAVVTVGFLIADATATAAAANPGVFFIGVDQFHANPLPNLVGIQFREDQAGFLVGALAAQVSTTGKIAGVYGIDIPPVKKFRNGFEQGAKYINPDIELAGVYIPDFVAPQLGAEAAEQFVADGFDVVFGAGGPTGSGGIVRAAELGAMVIGVDQDEWVTTFGAGETPGADKIISSALKRVDQGVYDMVWTLAAGDALPDSSLYLMDAAVNGVGFAPAHDAVISEEIVAKVQEVFTLLASGELSTGVDAVTGDLLAE